MLYKNFANNYITGVCRDCMNQASGFQLNTRDCLFHKHSRRCPNCGDYRHIVADLRFRGRLKILLPRVKKK